MIAQALVPLKDLVEAKTRLAGLMSASERRSLAQAMAEDVLMVLGSHPQLHRVTLVSDDPSATMLAQTHGINHLSEAALGVSGLNQVIEAACDRLLDGDTRPMIVLHADLPLFCAEDITAVVASYQSAPGIVVGCDRHRNGSNLLAFDSDSRVRFCFGRDSYAAHRAVAEQAGVHLSEIYRPGISLDLDEAHDVAELMRHLPAAGDRTRALLVGTNLGRRLSLAVTALAAEHAGVSRESMNND